MGITFKEYAYLINPVSISDFSYGGVIGCPGDLIDVEHYVLKCGKSAGEETCKQCWNREMPYTVIAEAIKDTESLSGHKIVKGSKLKVITCLFGSQKSYPIKSKTSDGKFRWTKREDFKFHIKEEEKNLNKFKVGQKVRVKKYHDKPWYWDMSGKMDKWMGQIVTIKSIDGNHIKIEEDSIENKNFNGWAWRTENFEPLPFTKDDMKDGMMVETKNRKRYLWLYGTLRSVDGMCSPMNINGDLTNAVCSEFDIMIVGYPEIPEIVGGLGNIENILKSNFKEIIWVRHEEPEDLETKEISSDEAFKILKEHYGCDVKIKK